MANNEDFVKFHYIGYSNKYDQWRKQEGIVEMETSCVTSEIYDLYQDLAGRILSVLSGKRKANPVINLVMPFDQKTFDEGLGSKAFSEIINSVRYYRIREYNELNELLGTKWHYRGLNSVVVYSYVICSNVKYNLYRRRPII